MKRGVERRLVVLLIGFVASGFLTSANAMNDTELTISSLQTRGRDLIARKKWEEAVVVLKRSLDTNPSVEGSLDLSRALFYSGRREEALAALARAVEKARGSDKQALMSRASVISRQFLTKETFQVYEDGLNFLQARKYRAARDRFEKALEQERDNVDVLVRSGQCLELEGDHDSAAERLRIARRLNPSEPESSLWLGRALLFRGELQGALDELRAAKLAMPGSELAQVWYAEALVQSGNRVAAISQLEKDLRETPMNVLALATLSRLKLDAAGRDREMLASVRRDLQLARSRIDGYMTSKAPVTSDDELSIDLKEPVELVSKLDDLDKKLEARVASLRSGSESLGD